MKNNKSFPVQSELSMFLISLVILLLFIINTEFKQEVCKGLFAESGYGIAIVFIAGGMLVSIINIFIKRKKSVFEKIMMLAFAVLVNFIAGYFCGGYVLFQTKGFLAIFPLWNIINAFYLIFLYRAKEINIDYILDRHAKIHETAINLSVVISIFILSNFILKSYWAVTLSICIGYVTSLSNYVGAMIIRRSE